MVTAKSTLHILNNYCLNDEHIIMVHFSKINIPFFFTLSRNHTKTKGEQEEEGQCEAELPLSLQGYTNEQKVQFVVLIH